MDDTGSGPGFLLLEWELINKQGKKAGMVHVVLD